MSKVASLFACLSILLAGLHDPAAGEQPQPAPITQITLTATLKQKTCQEGQPVILDLALHNTDTVSRRVGGSADEESSFHITVTDSKGVSVPRTALGERILTPPTSVTMNYAVALDAGKTLLYHFNLAHLFDLSRAGDYDVSVSRRIGSQNTLVAGLLSVHLTEGTFAYSGQIAPKSLRNHSTFFYVADEDYSHWTSWAADGKYLAHESVVKCFRAGQDGSVSPTLNLPALVKKGAGSVAATPDGRFLYVSNDNSVSQFHVGADGALTSLVPATVSAQKFVRQLLMDPKGRFLYALGNFGNTLYTIGHDGHLAIEEIMPSSQWYKDVKHNIEPTDFGLLDSSGRFLYACSGETTCYRLGVTGRITAIMGTEHALQRKAATGISLGEQDTAMSLAPSQRFAYVLATRWTGPPNNPTASLEDVVLSMCVDKKHNLVPLSSGVNSIECKAGTYGSTSLTVDPTGHVLLVLNSQQCFIAPYHIESDGSLTALKIRPLYGLPQMMFFLPGSPLVYVNFMSNGKLAAYRINALAGLTAVNVSLLTDDFFYAKASAAVDTSTPLKRGSVNGGLQMSTRLPDDVQTWDKPLILTIALKNVSASPIGLGRRGSEMSSFRLEVAGPQRASRHESRTGGEPVTEKIPLLAAGYDLLDPTSAGSAELTLLPGQQC